MEKEIGKFVYWTPRILSIVLVLFLMLFSLDVFEPGLSAWEIAVGLFMHNIPALILAAVVAISWKREMVGGIVFILAGMSYVVMIVMNILKNPSDWYMLFWTLQISVPMFFIGILFILNWVKKERIKKGSPHPYGS